MKRITCTLALVSCLSLLVVPSEGSATGRTGRKSVAEQYRQNERVTLFNRVTDSLATIGKPKKKAREIVAKRRQLRKLRRFNVQQQIKP